MKNLIDVQVGSASLTCRPPNKIKKRMICLLAVLLYGAFGTASADDMLQQNTNTVPGEATSPHVKTDPMINQIAVINEPVATAIVASQPIPLSSEPPAPVLPLEEVSVDANIPMLPFVKISSGFGVRKHPLSGKIKSHRGIDLPLAAGTPILAPANGIVIFAGWKNGFGNVIKIDHGNGYETLFAHNSINLVHTGERVTVTTTIAKVGATGWATGPHIHFEIRLNGTILNPINFLKKQ